MDERPSQPPIQGPYPSPSFQPQQLPPSAPNKPKCPTRGILLLVVLIIITLGVLGGVVWLTLVQTKTVSSNNTSVSHGSSLTLYYSDGKTVLWGSGMSTTVGPAPAFVAYVQGQLRAQYGNNYLSQGNWAVTTTLNDRLQAAAVKQVQNQQAALKQQGANDGAFMAENVTNGQIVSWVGNLDNQGTPDNTQLPSNIGPLQLPFTYAAYLTDTSNTLNTTLNDTQMPLPGWPCTDKNSPLTDPDGANCLWDSDHTYLGSMTAYQALAKGRLIPAAEAAFSLVSTSASNYTSASNEVANINKVLSLTRSMGGNPACYNPVLLEEQGRTVLNATAADETQCGGAAAIGQELFATPQHTLQAYATLANSGKVVSQTVLLKVILNGVVRYDWTQSKVGQVISDTVARDITGALSDSSASALQADKSMFTTTNRTKTAISYGIDAANDAAASVQFTPEYAAGFWVYGKQTQTVSNPLRGQMDTLLIPVTYSWLSAL